jgi:hypothetical protein
MKHSLKLKELIEMIVEPYQIERALKSEIALHEERASTGGFGIPGYRLCDLFPEYNCEGCPIANLTSQERCYGTPYDREDNQRDQMCVGGCPKDCPYYSQCSGLDQERFNDYCIIEEINEVAFLKWVLYNYQQGWI